MKLTKLALLSVFLSTPVFAATFEMYKSPYCGCCGDWAEIMEKKGHTINVTQDQEQWSAIKQEFGMPSELQSCHTTIVDGYLIEGHVPEADIMRLLKERPKNIKGITAPGMPAHSPGMVKKGEKYRDFDVVAFNKEGKTFIYNSY